MKHLNQEISNKFPSKYLNGYAATNPNLSDHLKTHFINEEAYQAALNDDFHTFIEMRDNVILGIINRVCRITDGIQTVNSNLDESEQEVLLDDGIVDDLA